MSLNIAFIDQLTAKEAETIRQTYEMSGGDGHPLPRNEPRMGSDGGSQHDHLLSESGPSTQPKEGRAMTPTTIGTEDGHSNSVSDCSNHAGLPGNLATGSESATDFSSEPPTEVPTPAAPSPSANENSLESLGSAWLQDHVSREALRTSSALAQDSAIIREADRRRHSPRTQWTPPSDLPLISRDRLVRGATRAPELREVLEAIERDLLAKNGGEPSPILPPWPDRASLAGRLAGEVPTWVRGDPSLDPALLHQQEAATAAPQPTPGHSVDKLPGLFAARASVHQPLDRVTRSSPCIKDAGERER